MTLLAISADEPADSRTFARRYGLAFPLLADTDHAVARMYSGVTSDGADLAGVVIIARDGRIVFRRLAATKDDRMSAAELLATLDATLGTSGPVAAGRGYAPIDRAQLRLDLGGGAVHDDDFAGTAVGELSALFPLGTHVLVGPAVRSEPREAPLDVDGALIIRAPIWHDLGALELGVTGGWSPAGDTAWNVGGRAGMWFAVTPSLSVQLGATVTVHGDDTAAFLTLGVARLLRLR